MNPSNGNRSSLNKMKRISPHLSVLILMLLTLALSGWLAIPPRASTSPSSSFSTMSWELHDLPSLATYTARDGTHRAYRTYTADPGKILILLHGAGSDSRSLHPLARHLADEKGAMVVLPDLRGHGLSPERRGDVDYIGQLEDDLADLIYHLQGEYPGARFLLGGHSLGGGLTLRFAGSSYGALVEGYLLLAPFLGHNAPITRPKTGWAVPHIGRIVVLMTLNQLGITRYNGTTVIAFNMTPEAQAYSTPTYTFRLQTSYAPRDYRTDLSAIRQPLLLLAGTADESFFADEYETAIQPHAEATVALFDSVTHLGILLHPDAYDAMLTWLELF